VSDGGPRDAAGPNQATLLALRAAYNLSKRAAVHAAGGQNGFAAGIRHAF